MKNEKPALKYERKFSAQIFYLVLFAAAVVPMVVFTFQTQGEAMFGLFFCDYADHFMDLFNPIKFVFGDDPYADRDMGAFYPAICYAFYKLLSFIYPEKYHAEDVTAFNLRDASYGTFYIISGTVLFVAALVLLFVYKLRGKNIFYIVAVVYSVLYASPILFLWERANILELSLVFLLFFACGKDSKNAVVRELSYICLALSAAFKIYPALFGIVLLTDRKWFAALRTAVYGIICFFVPFWFFDGLKSIKSFWANLTYGMDVTDYELTGVGYRVDLKNQVSLYRWFRGGDGTVVPDYYDKLHILLIICMVIGFFLLRDVWKKYLCLTVIMIITPAFSYEYCTVLFIVPFAFFMASKSFKPIDYLYAIDLILLLAPLILKDPYLPLWDIKKGFVSHYPLTLTVFTQNLGLVILYCLLGISSFFCLISRIMDLVKFLKAHRDRKAAAAGGAES